MGRPKKKRVICSIDSCNKISHIGRKLLENENVHHKNGDKKDNRLENLELWITSQPPGQRIEDLILWARSILKLYEKDFESGKFK